MQKSISDIDRLAFPHSSTIKEKFLEMHR